MHNLTPFISMQNHHSLVYREEEREMFPTLKHFGVGIIPWSPLARGLLTRPYNGDTTTKRGDGDPWVCTVPAALFTLRIHAFTIASLAIWTGQVLWKLSKGPYFRLL